MATETLGRRIIDTAVRYKEARGNADKWDAWDDLKALAARADAAERGMVAAVAVVSTKEVFDDADPTAFVGAMYAWGAAKDERAEALAAWRAITEVVQP